MTEQPAIRTTVVGSYPVPDWLAAFPTEGNLVDATRVVLHTQERAGLDLVCDGELYRFDVDHPETNGMIDYFIRPMDGIRTEIRFGEITNYRSRPSVGYRGRPAGIVEGTIGSGSLDLPMACARAVSLSGRPLKFTVTGPHMLCKTLENKHYADTEALCHALAGVLAEQVAHCQAEVIQLDEANLAGSPKEWPWAAAAMNKVLDAVQGIAGVHLCFGNYGGQTVQRGTWLHLIDYLNSLHADHVVLECAHRPEQELEVFQDLRPEIGMGLGVVDVKRTEIESADDIARAIERADRIIGAHRVRYVHPDCGFWMLKRSVVDAKIRALVAGRDLYLGRATESAA